VANCESWKQARLWKCETRDSCRKDFKHFNNKCIKSTHKGRKSNWKQKKINTIAIGYCFTKLMEKHRQCAAIANKIETEMMDGITKIPFREAKKILRNMAK
jgi:hypothetical protein